MDHVLCQEHVYFVIACDSTFLGTEGTHIASYDFGEPLLLRIVNFPLVTVSKCKGFMYLPLVKFCDTQERDH